MADKTASPVAASTASPAPKTEAVKKAAKARNPKPKPTHPSTADMVNTAVKTLAERNGSSLQAIKKYIAANYKIDTEKHALFIKKYLKSAVAAGTLVQTKGKGASGSFKLAVKKTDASKPKAKPKAAKKEGSPTKAAVKKPVKKTEAAKPKAKKAASPKKTAAKKPVEKKAAKPKVTKAAAKPKSPKAKKATKVPTAKPKAPKPKKAVAPKAKPAAKKTAQKK
ncbi:histone H1 [Fopius arisanus]|uniref:Histone H1 n=2 Tax=Fopius arisanus TaxID=64838 RepID=A0A9R1TLY2_9HYME|nr:PREDICTED: histone H1-like [Fopius arisanus]